MSDLFSDTFGQVSTRAWQRLLIRVVLAGLGVMTVAACSRESVEDVSPPPTTPSTSMTREQPTTSATTTTSTAPSTTAVAPPTTVAATTTTAALSAFARPDWLGTRVLPLRPDGFGEIQPTPAALADRRFETIDHLAPPINDAFVAVISPLPDDVLGRASWQEACPVSLDELRYVTVSHWGFDGRAHTGEIIVNTEEADNIVSVFEKLYDARFPIEQMRVATAADIDAPPTGDGNGTGSFVCRPVRGATKWSQHAYGLAIDINPFHNPYARRDIVLPELASAYVDRTRDLPGMIHPDSVVVDAFADIGWTWGGNWNSLKDWMHFSRNGR